MDAAEGQKGPHDHWDREPGLRLESRQIFVFHCHSMVMSLATLVVLDETKEWRDLMSAGPQDVLTFADSKQCEVFCIHLLWHIPETFNHFGENDLFFCPPREGFLPKKKIQHLKVSTSRKGKPYHNAQTPEVCLRIPI